ncbi:uncharacterized protein STEHIDRAFT_159587 [Stereum hirsutum FP-91666 SS1]|uniref:uncharacterized protein n=1 Tax=Stereum hirsutum (strain FP-91666) TaxID=721885 RepID=UPI000444A4FB|nr:uncharacterized protein STEHIDRAFT_159587 [Stereum hirsutum FP-91666 SS1]EIM83983.1 hypothetical protein STEHIDRAFT_159587 [Stereum hirsutum FP-91666 SS1]
MSGMVAVNQIAAESVSGGDEATASLITTALGLIHVLQVYTSVMVAVAVWDWLTCLKMEWERIWKRNWTLVKFLYLWTRYYGLLCFSVNLWLFNANFTTEQCKALHYIIAASCMWATLGSEAILAVRTWAFMAKARWVGIMLVSMLLGEMVFLLYVSIAGVHQTVLVFDGPCTASDAPGKHVVMGFWLAPVLFDLICTGLTLFKAIKTNSLVRSPLLVVFIREGLFYFLAVSAVNVLNAAFMFQSNANIQNINSFLALILGQVLCCRLVLNLRAPSDALESNTFSGPRPPTMNRSRNPTQGVSSSIPLGNLTSGGTQDEDLYGGVKVHVDVETDSRGDRVKGDRL